MNLEIAQQNTVAIATAHGAFLQNVTGMFHWFQEAVKGYSAEMSFDDEFNSRNALILDDAGMPERLKNEWSAFAKTLRNAYTEFGGEVVKRMGVDEPAQVRNLALSIAGGAFRQARSRAQEFLVSQFEAQFDSSSPDAIVVVGGQNAILALATAHGAFLQNITGGLHWFQEAVKGYSAELSFDDFLSRTAGVQDPNMPERLKNEWAAFERSLGSAYSDFGGEVVKRVGFDEPAQVRNLALSIAGGAFQQARKRAQEFLVSQVEAQVVPA